MDAYDAQFQYELSLCRPAITSHTDSTEFTTCFREFLKTNRDLIHTVSKPCPYTLPQDCIEDFIQATDSPLVKESFQRHHENAILFLKGKGSSLFVGHNTTKEPAFQPVKLCKALGVCLASIALLLLIAALLWNNWPKWFSWILGIVTGGNVISITILCNLNIIFNNHRKDSGNEW